MALPDGDSLACLATVLVVPPDLQGLLALMELQLLYCSASW